MSNEKNSSLLNKYTVTINRNAISNPFNSDEELKWYGGDCSYFLSKDENETDIKINNNNFYRIRVHDICEDAPRPIDAIVSIHNYENGIETELLRCNSSIKTLDDALDWLEYFIDYIIVDEIINEQKSEDITENENPKKLTTDAQTTELRDCVWYKKENYYFLSYDDTITTFVHANFNSYEWSAKVVELDKSKNIYTINICLINEIEKCVVLNVQAQIKNLLQAFLVSEIIINTQESFHQSIF